MADTNTNTTIIDGDKKVVQSFVHTYVDTGEGTAVKKIDVSELASNTSGQACTNVRITKIKFSTVGCSVKILGNATTDVLLVLVVYLILLQELLEQMGIFTFRLTVKEQTIHILL